LETSNQDGSKLLDSEMLFLVKPIPCGATITYFATALVTNDKRHNNGAKFHVYPRHEGPLKKSFALPPNIHDYELQYTLCCECTIRSQTQNDFGNLCNAPARTSDSARVRQIACYENSFWTWAADWCFVGGLTIGCTSGHTATWTSPVTLATYLDDESTPAVLTQNWVDPPLRALGGLAGETAGLALNLKFDECDAEWSTSCNNLRDLTVCRHPTSIHNDCQPFWGSTIGQIFNTANSVLGGCSSGNVNQLRDCVRYINRAFVDGKRAFENPDFIANGGCVSQNP